MLNDYFCSQTVVDDNDKILPQQTFTCNSRLNSITISQQDVRDVLNNLNRTKVSGPDLFSPRLLKEGATTLDIIFNRSLLQCYFPSNWKDANVTAIKNADTSMPSNARHILSKSNRKSYWKGVSTSTFTSTYQKTTFLHLFSLVLFKVTLQPSDSNTNTIFS